MSRPLQSGTGSAVLRVSGSQPRRFALGLLRQSQLQNQQHAKPGNLGPVTKTPRFAQRRTPRRSRLHRLQPQLLRGESLRWLRIFDQGRALGLVKDVHRDIRMHGLSCMKHLDMTINSPKTTATTSKPTSVSLTLSTDIRVMHAIVVTGIHIFWTKTPHKRLLTTDITTFLRRLVCWSMCSPPVEHH